MPKAERAGRGERPTPPGAADRPLATRRGYDIRSKVCHVNELCWVSLQVHDVEKSRRFWREVIGLAEKSSTPQWVELELRPGLLLALHPVFYAKALERSGSRPGRRLLGPFRSARRLKDRRRWPIAA